MVIMCCLCYFVSQYICSKLRCNLYSVVHQTILLLPICVVNGFVDEGNEGKWVVEVYFNNKTFTIQPYTFRLSKATYSHVPQCK